MTPKVDNELFYNIVRILVGDEAVEIVSMLGNKPGNNPEATDEELATKLEIKLNIVRKILYKLYDYHLAVFRRIRDKKTGWFVYFWKLNPERIGDLVNNKKKLVLQKLRERLDYEKNHVFYQCNNGCPRFTFEDAMEVSFNCPKCQIPLKNITNTDIVEILEINVEILEDDLK